jgi:hypothetical protein
MGVCCALLPRLDGLARTKPGRKWRSAKSACSSAQAATGEQCRSDRSKKNRPRTPHNGARRLSVAWVIGRRSARRLQNRFRLLG